MYSPMGEPERRPRGRPSGGRAGAGILPVAMCLSQSLSHACPRIGFYTARPRMAHQTSFHLDQPYSTNTLFFNIV